MVFTSRDLRQNTNNDSFWLIIYTKMINLAIGSTFWMKVYGVASSKLNLYGRPFRNLWMDGSSLYLVHLFEARQMLVIRWLPDDTPLYFLVFRPKCVDRVFFIAHEEYLGAVALTCCTRGNHTHWLASYFLVRSFIALRLPSDKYRCFVMSGPCRRYLEWWPSLSLFQSLT